MLGYGTQHDNARQPFTDHDGFPDIDRLDVIVIEIFDGVDDIVRNVRCGAEGSSDHAADNCTDRAANGCASRRAACHSGGGRCLGQRQCRRQDERRNSDLAVMAVTTDSRVPDGVVSQIAGSDGFVSGRSVALD